MKFVEFLYLVLIIKYIYQMIIVNSLAYFGKDIIRNKCDED